MGFPALNHLGPGPKSLGLAGPLKPSAKSLHPPPEPGNARCTFDPVFPFSPSALLAELETARRLLFCAKWFLVCVCVGWHVSANHSSGQ